MTKAKQFRFIGTALVVAGMFFAAMSAAANQFTVLPDSTLQDSAGLMWAPDAGTPGYATCAGGTKSWQAAADYVACLNTNVYLGHNDWRVPTAPEMASLAHGGSDPAGIAGSLTQAGFKNVRVSNYWSSSEMGEMVGMAIDMALSGDMLSVNKASTYFVWPVRGTGPK